MSHGSAVERAGQRRGQVRGASLAAVARRPVAAARPRSSLGVVLAALRPTVRPGLPRPRLAGPQGTRALVEIIRQHGTPRDRRAQRVGGGGPAAASTPTPYLVVARSERLRPGRPRRRSATLPGDRLLLEPTTRHAAGPRARRRPSATTRASSDPGCSLPEAAGRGQGSGFGRLPGLHGPRRRPPCYRRRRGCPEPRTASRRRRSRHGARLRAPAHQRAPVRRTATRRSAMNLLAAGRAGRLAAARTRPAGQRRAEDASATWSRSASSSRCCRRSSRWCLRRAVAGAPPRPGRGRAAAGRRTLGRGRRGPGPASTGRAGRRPRRAGAAQRRPRTPHRLLGMPKQRRRRPGHGIGDRRRDRRRIPDGTRRRSAPRCTVLHQWTTPSWSGSPASSTTWKGRFATRDRASERARDCPERQDTRARADGAARRGRQGRRRTGRRRHRPGHRAAVPRARAARRRARRRQDAARPHAGAGADARLQARAVHARPDAGRRHGLAGLRRRGRRSSSSARARSSPTCCSPTRSTARRRRRRPRCWRRWRSARSPSRACRARCPTRSSSCATQNPIEYEGTYPLPEAQLDRFLVKLTVPLPSRDDEIARAAAARRGLRPARPGRGRSHPVAGPSRPRRRPRGRRAGSRSTRRSSATSSTCAARPAQSPSLQLGVSLEARRRCWRRRGRGRGCPAATT